MLTINPTKLNNPEKPVINLMVWQGWMSLGHGVILHLGTYFVHVYRALLILEESVKPHIRQSGGLAGLPTLPGTSASHRTAEEVVQDVSNSLERLSKAAKELGLSGTQKRVIRIQGHVKTSVNSVSNQLGDLMGLPFAGDARLQDEIRVLT
jgi:hypothetical protein